MCSGASKAEEDLGTSQGVERLPSLGARVREIEGSGDADSSRGGGDRINRGYYGTRSVAVCLGVVTVCHTDEEWRRLCGEEDRPDGPERKWKSVAGFLAELRAQPRKRSSAVVVTSDYSAVCASCRISADQLVSLLVGVEAVRQFVQLAAAAAGA